MRETVEINRDTFSDMMHIFKEVLGILAKKQLTLEEETRIKYFNKVMDGHLDEGR